MDRCGSDNSPITLFLSKVSQKLPTKSNVLARIKEALELNQPYYEPWFEDKMKLCFLIKNKRCLPTAGNEKRFLSRYLGQRFSYNQMYKSWEMANGYEAWYKRNESYEGDDLGLSKEHLLYFKSALRQEYYTSNNSNDIDNPSSTTSSSSTDFVPQVAEMESIASIHSAPLNKHKHHHDQSDINTGKNYWLI